MKKITTIVLIIILMLTNIIGQISYDNVATKNEVIQGSQSMAQEFGISSTKPITVDSISFDILGTASGNIRACTLFEGDTQLKKLTSNDLNGREHTMNFGDVLIGPNESKRFSFVIEFDCDATTGDWLRPIILGIGYKDETGVRINKPNYYLESSITTTIVENDPLYFSTKQPSSFDEEHGIVGSLNFTTGNTAKIIKSFSLKFSGDIHKATDFQSLTLISGSGTVYAPITPRGSIVNINDIDVEIPANGSLDLLVVVKNRSGVPVGDIRVQEIIMGEVYNELCGKQSKVVSIETSEENMNLSEKIDENSNKIYNAKSIILKPGFHAKPEPGKVIRITPTGNN